jgi:tRNA dimethylallyltransferase
MWWLLRENPEILSLQFYGLKMPYNNFPNPLVVIVGPTGVGKTEISLYLAARLNGEIVSADSRLFYRGMDIGTAKPSLSEQAMVRHHLIDVSSPAETWSLALFQDNANRTILDIQKRERLPFLVGGTGQYIRAITEGWLPPHIAPDDVLRKSLELWMREIGGLELHRKLSLLDAKAAAVIDPRNTRRTIRAIEVIFKTGKPFSEQRGLGYCHNSILQIGLIRPRDVLYRRIDDRIEQMVQNGFIQEVQHLLEQGFSRELPSLSAIGYREIISHLAGEISLDEAVQKIKRQTRQYVRRQANWFKPDDPHIHWFSLEESSALQIEQFIASGKGWAAVKENGR